MRTLIAVALTALLCTTTAATAASLITGKQVKNGTLTGADIKNRSIHISDLAPSARATQGPTGTPGPQGPAGPRGLKGDTGAAGVAPQFRTGYSFDTLDPGVTSTITAPCPDGLAPISDAYIVVRPRGATSDPQPTVLGSQPIDSSWEMRLRNDGTSPFTATVYAICLNATGY